MNPDRKRSAGPITAPTLPPAQRAGLEAGPLFNLGLRARWMSLPMLNKSPCFSSHLLYAAIVH